MKRTLFFAFIALAFASLSFAGKPGKDNLRVLYWNIQNGMWCGQPTDYKEFVDFVREKNPDVCVWCEAATIYHDGTYTKRPKEECYLPAHWDELAGRYGHKYVFLGGFRDNYPQVITSKYPIEGLAQIVGNNDTIVSHGAGWARIVKNGHPVNIVSLHTWPQRYSFDVRQQPDSVRKADGDANGGFKYRRKEMEYICRHTILSQPGSENEMWMMMGDFNSLSRLDNRWRKMPADTPAYWVNDYVLENTPYLDAVWLRHPGEDIRTCPGGPGARIDYIYLTRPLYDRLKDIEVVRDGYTKQVQDKKFKHFWHPSDHLPILMDLDMKK